MCLKSYLTISGAPIDGLIVAFCAYSVFVFSTRKLSYRKDGREKFRESLTTPTATFPEIFNGLFFRRML